LLCTIVAILSMAACRRQTAPAPTVLVEERIDPQPPVVGPATVTIGLTDGSGRPSKNARVTVESDMSHAGMGPVFAECKEVENGRCLARIDFTMAGDWVLLLHIRLPDGQTVERRMDVKGVREK
jgi:hypothetical protein